MFELTSCTGCFSVPSLTKYLDFKHVYKMDHLMQDYSKW